MEMLSIQEEKMVRRKEFDALCNRVALLAEKDVFRGNEYEWAIYCEALIKFLGIRHRYTDDPGSSRLVHKFERLPKKSKK